LREVEYMPVYMAFYIGNSFFKKSGKQPFTDVDCAKDTMVHAMLLIGYDEKTLTFRNSYGKSFGDGGYVHINRGPLTRTCNYWKEAQVLTVSYRREIQYAKVSGEYNFNDARAECQKMDTDTESGWDLAIIPTQMHQNQLMKLFNSESDRLQIHIGLVVWDHELQWIDPLEATAYLPGTMNDWPSGKTHLTLWELDKKNKAKLILHNNFKRKAFVACSRFTTCWNFDTFIPNAIVEYDDHSRKEGTVATITCGHPFKLSENGPSTLTCKGGKWKDSAGKIYHPPSTTWLDARSKRNDYPKCKV